MNGDEPRGRYRENGDGGSGARKKGTGANGDSESRWNTKQVGPVVDERDGETERVSEGRSGERLRDGENWGRAREREKER